MAKRYHGSYEGMADTRAQEKDDAAMIGNSGFAGMPGEVVWKTYKRTPTDMPENLDDTMKGIDKQIGSDNAKKNQHIQKEKV